MKTINVFSTATNELRVITTPATTWGELYDALSNGSYSSSDGVTTYDLNNTSCKVKETRLSFDNTASGKSAALPSGLGDGADFTLFVVPQKIKSGNFITAATVHEEVLKLNAKLDILADMFQQFMNSVECTDTKQDVPTQLKETYVSDHAPSPEEVRKEELRASLAEEAYSFVGQ